jgi:hypothetical protein
MLQSSACASGVWDMNLQQMRVIPSFQTRCAGIHAARRTHLFPPSYRTSARCLSGGGEAVAGACSKKEACHSERSPRSEESPISSDACAITEEIRDCRYCFEERWSGLLRFFAALRMTCFWMRFGFAESAWIAAPRAPYISDRSCAGGKLVGGNYCPAENARPDRCRGVGRLAHSRSKLNTGIRARCACSRCR